MKSLSDNYVLSNGVKIPCIGFGTWQISNGEEAVNAVKKAIQIGYRHIDTAYGYKNEESVGIAVKESGIPRNEIFITSKLDNHYRGYNETLEVFEETLRNLGTEYVDLFLIHWPNPIHFRDNWEKANAESWRAFETLYKAGKIRAIGVSNFMIHHLEALLKTVEVLPMVNQIRLCPGCTQDELVEYCRKKNILLQAYNPLGNGLIFNVPLLESLAQRYNKTVAQIAIRWSLQRGFLPLPKSINEKRMIENIDVFDFEISAEDMYSISKLNNCCGGAPDPDSLDF